MLFLYKYYSSFDFVLDTIINKRLYFSCPNDFNDPFDCRPKFSLIRCKNYDIKDWKDYLSILAKEEYPGISDVKSLKHADAALKKGLHQDKNWLVKSDKSVSQVLNEELNVFRICCFTRTPRNQMMWAHYANNHKGIVLQFRSSYMLDVKSGTFKGFSVDYYSKHISLKRYVDSMKEALQGDDLAFSRFMYCSKSIEWAQEEEIRFFSNDTYMRYPEKMLTGILLGSNCPSHLEDLVHKVLSSWINKPKIYKEDVSKSSIKMYFKLVN
jgi:hypothetical protein